MNIIFNEQILENIGVLLFHVNSLIDLKVHLMDFNNTNSSEIVQALDVAHGLKESSHDLYSLLIKNIKTN